MEKPPKKTPEEVEAALIDAVRASPGGNWGEVLKASHVGSTTDKTEARKRLLADGKLVNRGKGTEFALWLPDDPALPTDEQLRVEP